jgi:transcriptional regulator NrdR family protein
MKCPKCEGATQVRETRDSRRRRWCLVCDHRFSTLEVLAETIDDQARGARPERAVVAKPKKPVLSAKDRAAARRKIEDRREAAVYDRDWFSDEHNYLPDA